MTVPNPAHQDVAQQQATSRSSATGPADPSSGASLAPPASRAFFLAIIVAMFLVAMPFLPQFHNGQYLMIQLVVCRHSHHGAGSDPRRSSRSASTSRSGRCRASWAVWCSFWSVGRSQTVW